MTVPTNIPEKQLSVTVELKFNVPVDAQKFGYYNPEEQADELKKQLLGDSLLDYITDEFNNDTLVIDAEVKVTEKKDDEDEEVISD